MAVLIVPPLDEEPYPTLGPQIADLIETYCIFGPGSLKGLPAVLDDEKRAALYRLYEVFPPGHQFAGRRRFKRGGISWRKGLAKTEFGAWVTFAELHPEGPVRCDGFDAAGEPVGRPVRDPYIPMLAVTVEQVEELAYGALMVMCQDGPDADLFDATQERIIRLDERGKADGKAVPLANSPGSRDGARTTFQFFDEPHRLHLPRQRDAHTTMDANLDKRVLEDPWTLYVGTAGEPGQGSVAEDLHHEAERIESGADDDPQLFYFYRAAGTANPATGEEYDLDGSMDDRMAAISEATGPVGEYGPGQFHSIAKRWDRPGVDKPYLERVWLNRWTRSNEQAFSEPKWKGLARPGTIKKKAAVAAGFDGARFRDSTAIVITELATGTQEVFAVWERPDDEEDWEVPEEEVNDAFARLFRDYLVWKVYADPPYWVAEVAALAGRYAGKVEEWWTTSTAKMAKAVRAYREAMDSGAVGWSKDHPEADTFRRHIAAAGRQQLNLYDDDGERLFILKKIHPDRKFDVAMAGCLSWTCYLDAVKSGANVTRQPSRPRRIR